MSAYTFLVLEAITDALDDLVEHFVFIGGLIGPLLITDQAQAKPRPTKDADVIVDVLSLGDYYQLIERVKAKGFREDPDGPICRLKKDFLLIDIMPAKAGILPFHNKWYEPALLSPADYCLPNGVTIKIVSAPYYIATKIEAFRDRGGSDFLHPDAHDFEDIVSVIDGRQSICEEILGSPVDVKGYIKEFFEWCVLQRDFKNILPGFIEAGREGIVIERMNEIIKG